MIRVLALAIVAAPPAAALDFGQAAEVLCIGPYEAVMAPNVSGLDLVERAPDFVETGDAVYAIEHAYLVISGDFATQAGRCELYADLDPEQIWTVEEWFDAWANAGIDAGRYLVEDGALVSDDWREPKMRVALEVVNGVVRLIVEDTDEEA